jgi:hypothetical protein
MEGNLQLLNPLLADLTERFDGYLDEISERPKDAQQTRKLRHLLSSKLLSHFTGDESDTLKSSISYVKDMACLCEFFNEHRAYISKSPVSGEFSMSLNTIIFKNYRVGQGTSF